MNNTKSKVRKKSCRITNIPPSVTSQSDNYMEISKKRNRIILWATSAATHVDVPATF